MNKNYTMYTRREELPGGSATSRRPRGTS
jgi:hypothetical protein